ncbi:MAG: single-stranded DNA-binding protein [Bacteroidia bacterium]
MNSIRNKVTLIGNLGNNPEVKVLDNNKRVARLSVATNETYKNKQGEKITETTWHNVVAWGPLAQLVEKFLKKGSEVCLEGKLVNKSWTDKEGIKRYSTEILVHGVQLLGSKLAA